MSNIHNFNIAFRQSERTIWTLENIVRAYVKDFKWNLDEHLLIIKFT